MPVRGCVSYTTMIMGLSRNGFWREAVEVFRDMRNAGVMPMMGMCLSEALMMYREMLRAGLGPNDVMLVDLISVCGRLEAIREGRQFHGRIVKEGFDCYDFIQATIMNFYAGCGEMLLLVFSLTVGSISWILMSNLLADAGKWEEASLERRVMQSLRLTRSPGHSDVVWKSSQGRLLNFGPEITNYKGLEFLCFPLSSSVEGS